MGKQDKTSMGVEELKEMFFNSKHRAISEECFLEAIEKIQQGAFMEGYEYAITILKESIVKKQ